MPLNLYAILKHSSSITVQSPAERSMIGGSGLSPTIQAYVTHYSQSESGFCSLLVILCLR